ncbi:MAG: HupE/UreJ family protein [Opitutae bacterium]|nr:HupE/UreJ family protein [Opitutae bacterium]
MFLSRRGLCHWWISRFIGKGSGRWAGSGKRGSETKAARGGKLGGERSARAAGNTKSTPTENHAALAGVFAPLPLAFSFAEAWSYLWLGFKHILPQGYDHMLFVLGLFLFAPHWRPLLVQVTAFTAAHTLTLALAAFGVVSVSPRIVEPLIALSIVWVGVENLRQRALGRARVAVVFGFGLLHGLGFASALTELGVAGATLGPALLCFNGGVEAGQLAVLALAFAVLGWARGREDYRRRVLVPGSVLIAAVALGWTVQRIFRI